MKDIKVSNIDDQHAKELGKFHKVLVQIEILKSTLNCYAFLLKGVDMVLGVEWLM